MASRRSPASLTVTDLKPDTANRRQRTPRGAKMLVESFEAVGPARSIVIDEHNQVLAGNGVVEAAAEAGITKLHIVDADGKTLVAVRRTGLSDEEKRALAMYDNRTGELAEWVPDQLVDDSHHGLSLSPWFTEMEARKILKDPASKQPRVREIETSEVADRFWIAVRGPLKRQAEALQRLRTVLAELDLEVELGLAPATDEWTG